MEMKVSDYTGSIKLISLSCISSQERFFKIFFAFDFQEILKKCFLDTGSVYELSVCKGLNGHIK